MTLLQDSSGNTSSKRVAGIIGFFSGIILVFVCVYASLFLEKNIGNNEMSLVITLITSSIAILGSGVFEKKPDVKNEQKSQPKKEIYNEYEL